MELDTPGVRCPQLGIVPSDRYPAGRQLDHLTWGHRRFESSPRHHSSPNRPKEIEMDDYEKSLIKAGLIGAAVASEIMLWIVLIWKVLG